MSVIGSNILAGASGQGGGYTIDRSLRFRSSAGAFLNRTPSSAGNQQIFTWSSWVKRGTVSSGYPVLFMAGNTTNDYTFSINFEATDQITARTYGGSWVISNGSYRDPSAWYHIVVAVDTTQATSTNRVKLYVNGVQVSSTYGTAIPLNFSFLVNYPTLHRIGYQSVNWGFNYFDGYMAETNFIDGQQLTPSSFGANSSSTGVWQPIEYTGTYGTNGFYLPFKDNTSTTTLSADNSGNGNNWTTNNISLTAGATYDSMTDVPTLTSATVANYCVLNPIDATSGTSITNGNLNVTTATANFGLTKGTFWVSSGKWYWEITVNGTTSATLNSVIGITNGTETYVGQVGGYAYTSAGEKGNNNTFVAYGASYATNDIIGVAFDADGGTITFYKNGVSQGQAYSGISGLFTPAMSDLNVDRGNLYTANFGQRPFAYTPPTGFVALNTFNLPTPTIGATASTQANKYFDILLHTGNGGSQSVTGLNFQPDMAITKARSQANSHTTYDVVRGATNALFTNTTGAELNYSAYLNGFLSNGLSFIGGGGDTNQNGATYVDWCWKANGTGVTNNAGSITSTVSANTSSGFSVVTYTGTGANATVGHGLGVAPKMVIVKVRTTLADNNWVVGHTSIGWGNNLYLNLTNASAAGASLFNSTAPTSSVFSLGNATYTNNSGSNYVAYCFSAVAGYSAFGSYTGNGSSDGVFVYTGFRPKFILYKNASYAGTGWAMLDSSRNTYNVLNARLFSESSSAEDTSVSPMDFTSNGFKVRSTNDGVNRNGDNIIYMAFAENPFKYSLAR